MFPQALERPAGGFSALVRFHDGRTFLPAFRVFRTEPEARDFAEGWIREVLASYARAAAAAARHIQPVEAVTTQPRRQ